MKYITAFIGAVVALWLIGLVIHNSQTPAPAPTPQPPSQANAALCSQMTAAYDANPDGAAPGTAQAMVAACAGDPNP